MNLLWNWLIICCFALKVTFGCIKPMDYGPKEAFRDYGNNSFFLTEASKDNELKRDYQEVHNGFYAAVDGLTGLFYPENEVQENQRIENKSGTKILTVAGLPYKLGMKMEVMDLSDPEFACKNLPDYPVPIRAVIGGMVSNDTILICGDFLGF